MMCFMVFGRRGIRGSRSTLETHSSHSSYTFGVQPSLEYNVGTMLEEEHHDNSAPQEDVRHQPHEHARPRVLLGLAAVALIAVGWLAWARWGETVKQACLGEDGACEVDLGTSTSTATGEMKGDTPFGGMATSVPEHSESKEMVDNGTATSTGIGTSSEATSSDTSTVTITGVLTGKVTIGPICPVVREGESCETPPEAYTSRALYVRTPAMPEGAQLAQIPIQADGTWRVALTPGTYILALVPSGIDRASSLPHEVVVTKGATTTVPVIAIDTGIR